MDDVRPLDMADTKWKIFTTAIDLFSDKGYANVGIRDIADAVGIKSSSLYNHFENKDAILERIYPFFYDTYTATRPPLEPILAEIPGLPIREALHRLFPSPSDATVYELLKKAGLIAIQERSIDRRADDLVYMIFETAHKRVLAVLDKALELGLIEPIDVNLFAHLFIGFSLSATACHGDQRILSFADWRDGRQLLLTLIQEKTPYTGTSIA
jgi:AcrR family transcriptional regulator